MAALSADYSAATEAVGLVALWVVVMVDPLVVGMVDVMVETTVVGTVD